MPITGTGRTGEAGYGESGDLCLVKGIPFNFTQPVAIGARIDYDDEELRLSKGYEKASGSNSWIISA